MGEFFSHTISIIFDIIIVSCLILYSRTTRFDSFMRWFYPFFCILLLTSTYIRGSVFWWEANFFVVSLYTISILSIYFINNKHSVSRRVAFSFVIPFLASHLWELPNHFLWQAWTKHDIHDYYLLGLELGICVFIIFSLRAIGTKTNYKIFIPIAIFTILLCYIGGVPSANNTFIHSVCGNINRIGTILLLCYGVKLNIYKHF